MQRILHLRSSGGLLGAEAVILQLAAALPEFGYEVTVGGIFDERDGPPALLAVARARGFACAEIISGGRISISAIRSLRRLMVRGRFDLIHTHGYREDIFACLAAPRAPKVATNHLWKLTSGRLRAYAALDALVLRTFPRVVAVSQAIAEDMAKRGIRAEASRVIENGVATERLDRSSRRQTRERLRRRLDLSEDSVVFLMVSSLTPEKGHTFALTAFEKLAGEQPQTHLVIVGDGPLSDSLKAQALASRGGDRTHFLGRREDVGALLDAADVFLMSSLSEGLPMALLEAMSGGLPSIATAVGEIPRVLTTEEGRVVPSRDPVALAAAMQELMVSADLRRRLGDSAHRRVAEQYSARRMAERYARVYREVLGGR